MVQFLNAREPQAFLAGLGMLLILSTVAVAVLDGIVVAGMEVLGYFSADPSGFGSLWSTLTHASAPCPLSPLM